MVHVHVHVRLYLHCMSVLCRSREYDSVDLQFFCSPDEHRQWYSHWQKSRLQWWKKVSVYHTAFILVYFVTIMLVIFTCMREHVHVHVRVVC